MRVSLQELNARVVTHGLLACALIIGATPLAPAQFVTRTGSRLFVDGHPFYFVGTNAYYLLEEAARGDTGTVKALFNTANALGLSVVRTWAFFDSSDSLNPAVIQFRPGAYNESALRALDYVVLQAKLHNVRLLFPLVNSWDDYGGMNQYVEWRIGVGPPDAQPEKYSTEKLQERIAGPRGQSYRVALSEYFGHDDFYGDEIIKDWFKDYISMIVHRQNTHTGVLYRDEPAILGWELANEPRSSDRSTALITAWAAELSSFIKSLDPNHLVGTGEEGFDNTTARYTTRVYNNQWWLFDGSAGLSFTANSTLSSIDFASIHLYPESWNLPGSSGNAWIQDHTSIASTVQKPLIMGEFGIRTQRAPTYDSWLTTALWEEAAGAVVWQVLEGTRTDAEGFGFRCGGEDPPCVTLRNNAARFALKSQTGTLNPPSVFSLQQNYPNPFNVLTSISYTLPYDAHVVLEVFNITGQRVAAIVERFQRAGTRKELLDGGTLASGAFFYSLVVSDRADGSRRHVETKKMILMK